MGISTVTNQVLVPAKCQLDFESQCLLIIVIYFRGQVASDEVLNLKLANLCLTTHKFNFSVIHRSFQKRIIILK